MQVDMTESAIGISWSSSNTVRQFTPVLILLITTRLILPEGELMA